MDDSKEDLRLIEPESPDGLMPIPISWEAWCAIGGGLLILALLLFYLWRKHRRTTTMEQDPHAQARREALAALAICPTGNRTEAATECSAILRRYLVQVTGDRALYETHEEWVTRQDSIESLGEVIKQQLQTLFSQLAQSKYAPADHGENPQVMIENSRQLIESIHLEANT